MYLTSKKITSLNEIYYIDPDFQTNDVLSCLCLQPFSLYQENMVGFDTNSCPVTIYIQHGEKPEGDENGSGTTSEFGIPENLKTDKREKLEHDEKFLNKIFKSIDKVQKPLTHCFTKERISPISTTAIFDMKFIETDYGTKKVIIDYNGMIRFAPPVLKRFDSNTRHLITPIRILETDMLTNGVKASYIWLKIEFNSRKVTAFHFEDVGSSDDGKQLIRRNEKIILKIVNVSMNLVLLLTEFHHTMTINVSTSQMEDYNKAIYDIFKIRTRFEIPSVLVKMMKRGKPAYLFETQTQLNLSMTIDDRKKLGMLNSATTQPFHKSFVIAMAFTRMIGEDDKNEQEQEQEQEQNANDDVTIIFEFAGCVWNPESSENFYSQKIHFAVIGHSYRKFSIIDIIPLTLLFYLLSIERFNPLHFIELSGIMFNGYRHVILPRIDVKYLSLCDNHLTMIKFFIQRAFVHLDKIQMSDRTSRDDISYLANVVMGCILSPTSFRYINHGTEKATNLDEYTEQSFHHMIIYQQLICQKYQYKRDGRINNFLIEIFNKEIGQKVIQIISFTKDQSYDTIEIFNAHIMNQLRIPDGKAIGIPLMRNATKIPKLSLLDSLFKDYEMTIQPSIPFVLPTLSKIPKEREMVERLPLKNVLPTYDITKIRKAAKEFQERQRIKKIAGAVGMVAKVVFGLITVCNTYSYFMS